MQTGNCARCDLYDHCVTTCNKVEAELRRIEKPRRKHRIEAVNESDLPSTAHAKYMHCVWGECKEI